MFLSPKSTNIFPPLGGAWVPGTAAGARTAFFCCPGCHEYKDLGDEITTNGTAAVVCEPCGFDDAVLLMDWAGKSLK